MFTPDEYELIDFGEGRKLERFGDFVLDRPAPAAEGKKRRAVAEWADAVARYDRTSPDRGEWSPGGRLPERWTIRHDPIELELKPTDFGHLGVFPEQAENWDWIADQVAAGAGRPRVLNLFAYTGGSTLAAAAAGAEVVHVDAARNVMAWARRNARLSHLADAPIRWICEDAMRFVLREVKRGNRYEGLILDPPSFGHGPHGEAWKIAEHLPRLLEHCGELLSDQAAFLLLTCHWAGGELHALARWVRDGTLRGNGRGMTSRELNVGDRAGRGLNCGLMVRWSSHRDT